MRVCLNCHKELRGRFQLKYCSVKCQMELNYKKYIFNWSQGIVNGNRGINTKNISEHIKRYLIEKYKEKCSECGWNKKHSLNGHVPLEIDHIDGNAENNLESNLRLLCPNCHALTVNFKNFNKGKGRKWRKNKYIKYEL